MRSGDAPTTSVSTMMPTLSFSPKRKREPSESDCYSPSASPTSTVSIDSFQDPRFREDALGRHSPRAAVAGRFGELAIRGELQSDTVTFTDSQQSLASSAQLCAFDSAVPQNMPEALPASSESSSDRQATLSEAPATQYQPTPLPTSPSKKSTTFSHKHINSSPSPSKRKPRVSPPLADTPSEDPLVWHDSEITGHNPSDPSDDGYGINGIGFKPTASIAWARSQKRQKQVAEWKNREAREARERRRERRRDGVELDKIHSIHDGAIQKRVKFDV